MNHVSLPGGARLAVTVNVVIEWWTDHGKLPGSVYPNRCLGSTREYGVKVGASRILDVLKKNNTKSSVLVSGIIAEKFPELIRSFSDEGHDFAGHGYEQGRYTYKMTREEEHETIRRVAKAIEDACGHRPLGWSSPGRSCTDNTLELLMEEGFVWNGDLQDTDLPYPIRANGKTLMMVPSGVPCTDLEEFILFDPEGHRQTLRGPREALDLMIGLFDSAYDQSSPQSPLKMSLGWHAFLAGKPGYTWALDRFLQYTKDHKEVALLTNLELAQWWLKNCI
jgi:peptidoglycan/xylan/chitin deacetylase (PgdA/CDA1 family)